MNYFLITYEVAPSILNLRLTIVQQQTVYKEDVSLCLICLPSGNQRTDSIWRFVLLSTPGSDQPQSRLAPHPEPSNLNIHSLSIHTMLTFCSHTRRTNIEHMDQH